MVDDEHVIFNSVYDPLLTHSAGNDSPSDRSAADTLGFRPKPVSQDMVLPFLATSIPESHHSSTHRLTQYPTCFPTYLRALKSAIGPYGLGSTIPCHRDNIRYDLLRTGSVELSSNKILERGFLDPVRGLSLRRAHEVTCSSNQASTSIFHALSTGCQSRASRQTRASGSCNIDCHQGTQTKPDRPIQPPRACRSTGHTYLRGKHWR